MAAYCEESPDHSLPSENDLLEFQCPLTWKECSERFDDRDWIGISKEKFSFEADDWRIFRFNILIGCLQSHRGDEEAVTTFEKCENILNKNKDEQFFADIIEGLEHVLLCSRLFFFKRMGRDDAAKDLLPRIKKFSELNKVCKAAVFGMKAQTLRLFSKTLREKSLKFAKLAIEMDPDDFGFRRGIWYHVAGKILADIRRDNSFSEIPSDEELKLLRRSVKHDPPYCNYLDLADTCRETSKAIRKVYPRRAEQLCKEAKEMYETCIRHPSVNAVGLSRGGMGLIKLPTYRNLELAKKAFEKSMEDGNKHAAFCMGHLLNWNFKDYKGALEYYEKAYCEENTFAGLEIIKMRCNIDHDYNPSEDIKKFITDLEGTKDDRYNDLPVAYYMLKVEYLLRKGDLIAAVQEWNNTRDIFYDSKYLWDLNCSLKGKPTMMLCDLISREIDETLKNREISVRDRNFLEQFQSQRRSYEENRRFTRNRNEQ